MNTEDTNQERSLLQDVKSRVSDLSENIELKRRPSSADYDMTFPPQELEELKLLIETPSHCIEGGMSYEVYKYTLATKGPIKRLILLIKDSVLQRIDPAYRSIVESLGTRLNYIYEKEEIVLYIFYNKPPKWVYIKLFKDYWPKNLGINVKRYSISYIDELKSYTQEQRIELLEELLDLDTELDVLAIKDKVEKGNLNRSELEKLLDERLNLNELKRLCSNSFHIDLDNIPGDTKIAKISNLIEKMSKEKKLFSLIEAVNQMRKDITLESLGNCWRT